MTTASSVEIVQATLADEVAAVRRLILEYAEFLGESLCFQDFDQEIEDLPGKYAPPTGSLLLAREGARPAGCGAFRHLEGAVCEMKRMFVRAEFRGQGLGLRIAKRLIAEAAAAGYHSMRLDTIPARLPEATDMYRKLGFRQIPAYYDNPIPGVAYFELRLQPG